MTRTAQTALDARTRWLASEPPEVVMVTPETLTPATVSARSTAVAMAEAASSTLTMAPPRTPREAT